MRGKSQSAFTLIELLLVIGVLGALAAVSISYYRNFSKSRELDIVRQTIIYNLRLASGSAISGADQNAWGIHFVNVAVGDDYYQVFETPTNYADPAVVITDTVYLPSSITFSDPLSGATKDILFTKIKGTIASLASVTITSEGNSLTATVNVEGNIY